jgi:hypothetical protein
VPEPEDAQSQTAPVALLGPNLLANNQTIAKKTTEETGPTASFRNLRGTTG